MDTEDYLQIPIQYKIIEISGEGKQFYMRKEKLSAEVWWVFKYQLNSIFFIILILYFDYQLSLLTL